MWAGRAGEHINLLVKNGPVPGEAVLRDLLVKGEAVAVLFQRWAELPGIGCNLGVLYVNKLF